MTGFSMGPSDFAVGGRSPWPARASAWNSAGRIAVGRLAVGCAASAPTSVDWPAAQAGFGQLDINGVSAIGCNRGVLLASVGAGSIAAADDGSAAAGTGTGARAAAVWAIASLPAEAASGEASVDSGCHVARDSLAGEASAGTKHLIQ